MIMGAGPAQGCGSGRLHTGHSILTSIQRCRHGGWKQCPHGATIRAFGRVTSTKFMQMTHSTDP